ncbi:MAG: N-acetyl sugar amidotransferase [Betaproteobacteria bacterium]|nr:N-acetyl sugar amidotransferase [Betaproteobacteria bacterium]
MDRPHFQRANLDRQFLSLPDEVKFCTQCVISNQRPRITFDADGVCGACRNAHYKEQVDWKQRELELEQLLDQHRRSDGYWDCIVPSSGGKDSGFVAHQLREKWGMNPLTVTWTPMIYTDIGRENFQNFIDAGFTNLFCSPNGRLQRKMARLCFEELGDAFHVFVLGQVHYPIWMSLKFGVPLVFYGENGSVEYAGDPKLADKAYLAPEEWNTRLLKGCSLDELVDFGLKNKDYFNEGDFRRSDLLFYGAPPLEEVQRAGIRKYYYSYFHKWVPQENYYYAAEHTGLKANSERSEGTYSKYASLDDKLDGMHYYLGFIKFGFGRATQDASHEIRDGHITREEGVALVRRYDGEFPSRYFKDFLEFLDIDEEHFWQVVDSWRRPNIWDKAAGEWKLKHELT